MGDILTGTPAQLTYLEPAVQSAWEVVWVAVAGSLGLLLAWAGITMIFREHLGGPPTGWRDLVPRLMIAVVAASTSLWWGSFVIDLADKISVFVATALSVTPNDLIRAPLVVFNDSVASSSIGISLALVILFVVYGFFVLYVIGQLVIRLALINLLLVLAPAALGLWVLPHTSGWGRYWVRTFLTTVFQQALQLVALALAFAFLDQFAQMTQSQPADQYLWQLLLSTAAIYLTTRIPSMLGDRGIYDGWMRTLHYGATLALALPRTFQVAALMGVGWPRSGFSSAAGGGGFGGAPGSSSSARSGGFAGALGSPTPMRALPPASTPPALPPRSADE